MKPFIPALAKLPKRTVLTVTVVGSPNATPKIIPALYGTAYTTKFKVYRPKGKKMEIGELSAYWPDAHRKPKAKWTGVWMLDVSPFVKQRDLVQKDPSVRIRVKTLPAATIAHVLHVGTYASEGPTIKKLHAFIAEQGYRIAGPHEESYATKPGPKAKTIIRYAVVHRARKTKKT